jgi:DGQHR domain-containing protein
MATATKAPEVFTETTEDAAARAAGTTAPKRRGRKPRNTTAPAVKPMFSDNDENNPESIPDVTPDEVDTQISPADIEATEELNSEEVNEKVDKERRMQIRDEFVPGKSALATLTPDALKELAFVSTYNTVDDQSSSPRQHGYQRDPMAARFPAIGRYFAQQEGDGVHTHAHLITPIIASVRVYSDKDRARFNFLFDRGEIGKIHKEFGHSVVSIVDGQHRCGGLYWAWENKADFNPDVPVMLYYGLRYADEATLFDDINTNQRKLPKALIEATKVHMEAGEKTHAQVIREIAFGLAQDGDSPWYGLINMTGARDADKPITYEGLRRSISNMMHENVVNRLLARGFDPENVAKNYWTLVTRASANAWNGRPRLVETADGTEEVEVKYRLKDLVGVAAVSRLGQDVITTALDKSRTAEEFTSAMAELVSKLGEVDWVKEKGNPYMASSAGFAGMGDLYKILYRLVYLGEAPGVAA